MRSLRNGQLNRKLAVRKFGKGFGMLEAVVAMFLIVLVSGLAITSAMFGARIQRSATKNIYVYEMSDLFEHVWKDTVKDASYNEKTEFVSNFCNTFFECVRRDDLKDSFSVTEDKMGYGWKTTVDMAEGETVSLSYFGAAAGTPSYSFTIVYTSSDVILECKLALRTATFIMNLNARRADQNSDKSVCSVSKEVRLWS